ncbi:hypothetical protein CCACVL1_19419 [Corchorus capsularis]|uniref:Uncharacterized protein n=1 Tax=Corchorus capsularis TaxID=210143 RepID=A0A1R3HGS2_COCAP|nr:hypothetical protein CCACVL1_19419 [Corchorus capsularis]
MSSSGSSKPFLDFKGVVIIDVPDEDFEVSQEHCCIYEVPKSIRQAKEDDYTPQLISIGPLHHGNQKLAEMEKHKLRYLKKFCARTSNSKEATLGDFLNFIEDNEGRIGKCYQKSVSKAEFESTKFREMILLDAVFIIELFIRHKQNQNDDVLVSKPWLKRDIKVDLILLENQLPFFVLVTLYNRAGPLPDCPSDFLELACNFFNINLDSVSSERDKIKHFTDLKRWELVKNPPQPKTKPKPKPKAKPDDSGASEDIKWVDNLCNATKLHEAGVKFKAGLKPNGASDLLKIEFSNKELIIPPLIVHPYSESHTRNVIALEQCHYPQTAYVSAYIYFLVHLINTEEDVELLVKKGIIINRMGSTTAVAELFNKHLEGVERFSTCYQHIARDLIKCYKSSCNREIANLKNVYFKNLLNGTVSVAALLVVLFTFTQTIFAILERFKPIN